MTKSMKFLGLVLLIVGASGVYHDFNRLRQFSLTIPYLWFVFAFLSWDSTTSPRTRKRAAVEVDVVSLVLDVDQHAKQVVPSELLAARADG